MIGTLVNTGTILAGSILGSCLRRGIKKEYRGALFQAMGLAACALGVNAVAQNMPNSTFPVLFILSLAVGTLVGTMLNIDGHFQNLVGRFSKNGGLGQGLSTAILMFCIGTLSILGPINSALYGDHTYLFTNATLDFVHDAGLDLWHRYCLRSRRALLLAGGNLPVCRRAVRLPDR